VSQLEQLNKRYWYVCQDYAEYKYPHQPKRFPEIMMCLPEIRCIAGKKIRTALNSSKCHENLPIQRQAELWSTTTNSFTSEFKPK